MELEILKSFVNKNVEILVGGAWLEGHMTPIVKSVITLLPVGAASEFYGPAAVKAENVLAIRELRIKSQPEIRPQPVSFEAQDPNVRSSLDQVLPNVRFKKEKK